MPQFRFKVRDQEGFQKSGLVGAPNADLARKRMASQGYVVLEMTEVGAAVEKEEGAPSAPIESKPTPVPLALTERKRRSPGFKWMLAAVVVVAAAAGIYILKFFPLEPAPRVKFSVVGNLSVPQNDFQDVAAVLDFPEVPFQKRFTWKQLKHSEPESFQLEVDLELPKQPTRFTLTFSKPGSESAHSGYRLIPAPEIPLILEALALQSAGRSQPKKRAGR